MVPLVGIKAAKKNSTCSKAMPFCFEPSSYALARSEGHSESCNSETGAQFCRSVSGLGSTLGGKGMHPLRKAVRPSTYFVYAPIFVSIN